MHSEFSQKRSYKATALESLLGIRYLPPPTLPPGYTLQMLMRRGFSSRCGTGHGSHWMQLCSGSAACLLQPLLQTLAAAMRSWLPASPTGSSAWTWWLLCRASYPATWHTPPWVGPPAPALHYAVDTSHARLNAFGHAAPVLAGLP